MRSIRRRMRKVRARLTAEHADAEVERELAAHLVLLEDEMMTMPAVVLLSAAALAATPALMRAIRIEPAVMLRRE